MKAEPDYISIDDLVLGDGWGDPFTLDRIDALSVQVEGNPAVVRCAVNRPGGGYSWRSTIELQAGGWTDITDSLLGGFSHFQLRRAAAGSPSTVSVRAFCQGG